MFYLNSLQHPSKFTGKCYLDWVFNVWLYLELAATVMAKGVAKTVIHLKL